MEPGEVGDCHDGVLVVEPLALRDVVLEAEVAETLQDEDLGQVVLDLGGVLAVLLHQLPQLGAVHLVQDGEVALGILTVFFEKCCHVLIKKY